VQSYYSRACGSVSRKQVSVITAHHLYQLWQKGKSGELDIFKVFQQIYAHPGGIFFSRRWRTLFALFDLPGQSSHQTNKLLKMAPQRCREARLLPAHQLASVARSRSLFVATPLSGFRGFANGFRKARLASACLREAASAKAGPFEQPAIGDFAKLGYALCASSRLP
jgi:hypothetical protein